MFYPVDYTKIKSADDWHYAQCISMIRAGYFENLPEELLPENLVKWFREETEQLPFVLRMKMGAAAEYIEKQDGIIKAYQEIIRKSSQERREQENPQPLTIEELRQMDGEPVWVEELSKLIDQTGWALVEVADRGTYKGVPFVKCHICTWDVTFRGLHCYRHKPKEEQR